MKMKVRLKDISQIINGGTPSTRIEEYWNGDIPWITPKDLSGYEEVYISCGERNITTEGLNNSSAQLLPKNTILFSSRAPIGYVAIAANEVTTNQGFKNLICNKEIVDYKYLYYWLKRHVEDIKGAAIGSTFAEVSKSEMENLQLTLPPLPEQKRIANILSSFDNKIEILKKENKILEDIAENIFKEWFVKYNFPNKDGKPYKDNGGQMIDSELGPIPEGCRVGKLGELCNILGSGGTPTTTKVEYYGDKYDWFTTKELQDTFLLSSEKKISEAGLNNSSAKLFPKNSVLIAIYAAPTVGRLGILSHEGTFNQATCGLYANENSSNEFLFLYLLNERRNLNNLASGAAQQNLNVGIIKNYLVLCPDKITNKKFADTVKPLFEEIEVNIKKQANLLKQKKSLLKFLIK